MPLPQLNFHNINKIQLKLLERDATEHGYARLNFDVVKREELGEIEQFSLQNYKSLYYLVNVALGTPRQLVKVMLDTGSADLIIESVGNQGCLPTEDSAKVLKQNEAAGTNSTSSSSKRSLSKRKNIIPDNGPMLQKRKNIISEKSLSSGSTDGVQNKATSTSTSTQINCFANGFFAGNLSLSFNLNTSDSMTIIYGDSQQSKGHYATEDASIGDINLKGLNFGLIESGDTSLGVMGIGPKQLQLTYLFKQKTYDHVPYQIAQQHNLQKVAYSISLSDLHGQNGLILFGAVDKYKYTGNFATLPYGDSDGSAGFYINTDSIELHYDGANGTNSTNSTLSKSNTKYTTLLDTGSTLVSLPPSVVKSIQDTVPHTSSNSHGIVVDCSVLENDKNYLSFSFTGSEGKINIDVPFRQMNLTTAATGTTCTLGMSSSDDESALTLGDPFFRSSYVVFDMTDQQISIAKVNRGQDSEKEGIYIIG